MIAFNNINPDRPKKVGRVEVGGASVPVYDSLGDMIKGTTGQVIADELATASADAGATALVELKPDTVRAINAELRRRGRPGGIINGYWYHDDVKRLIELLKMFHPEVFPRGKWATIQYLESLVTP